MTNVSHGESVRNCDLGEGLRSRIEAIERSIAVDNERHGSQAASLRRIEDKVDGLVLARLDSDKLLATLAEHVAGQNGRVAKLESRVGWMLTTAIMALGSAVVSMLLLLMQGVL